MANKKINELDSRASLSLSDLMAVGDPSTGYLYKTTISDLKTLTGAGVISFNGRFGSVVPVEGDYALTQLSDVIITSASNGQVLKFNGSNWVNGVIDLSSYVTGTGTQNYLSKWNNAGGTSIGASQIIDDGTNVGVGKIPTSKFDVNGVINSSNDVQAWNGQGSFTANSMIFWNSNSVARFRAGQSTTQLAMTIGSTDFLRIFTSGNIAIQNGGTFTDAGYRLDVSGTGRFTGAMTASSLIKSGGTSSQFLKADGSVDSNTYLTSGSISGYLPLTGGNLSGTLGGTDAYFGSTVSAYRLTAQGDASNGGVVQLKTGGSLSLQSGYVGLGSQSANTFGIYFTGLLTSIIFSNSLLTAIRTYNYPDASGTVALTSDLSAYLPLSGGTMTGNLNLAANPTTNTYYIGQTMGNDYWRIYGNPVAADQGEMVFELGDNGTTWSPNGQRYRFFINNTSGGTAKSVLTLDYDTAFFSTNMGIGTTAIGNAGEKLIVCHSDVNTLVLQNNSASNSGRARTLFQFNNASATITNSALIEGGGSGATSGYLAFQTNNSGTLDERLRITAIGNVGVGNTTSDWNVNFKAIQLGSYGGYISGRINENSLFIGTNHYFDSATSQWIYTTTGAVSQMYFLGGDIVFRNNVSGTAGTATGFSERLRITSGGIIKSGGAFVRENGNVTVGGSLVSIFTMDVTSSRTYLIQMIPTNVEANLSYRIFGVIQVNGTSATYSFNSIASQTMEIGFSGATIQARITNGQQWNFNWSITQIL